MLNTILGFNQDEDIKKNLINRLPHYKLIANINYDFYNFMESFYDKKDEIIIAENDLKENFFKEKFFSKNILNSVSNENLFINKYGDNLNMYLSERKHYFTHYFNRYFYFSPVVYMNRIESIMTASYGFLLIKYFLENDISYNITNLCDFQYFQILKGLHNNYFKIKNSSETKKNNQDDFYSGKYYEKKDNKNEKLEETFINSFINEEFIIISYNNIFWRIIITDKPKDFYSQIDYVLSNFIDDKSNLRSEQFKEEINLGILSSNDSNRNFDDSENSNKYITSYFISISNENLKFINKLDTCLLLIYLDDSNSFSINQKSLFKKCLYYKNSYLNKLFHLNIFLDGRMSYNFEVGMDRFISVELDRHFSILKKYLNFVLKNQNPSQVDFDNSYLILMNNFFNYLSKKIMTKNNFSLPKKLAYTLDEKVLTLGKMIQSNINKELGNVNIVVIKTKKINENSFKFSKIKSEYFMYLAVLASLYRYTKDLQVVVSETSTRKFKYGGSEIFYINSKITNSFSLAMSLDFIPQELKINLFYKAINDIEIQKSNSMNGKSLYSRLNLYEKYCHLINSNFEKATDIKSNSFNYDIGTTLTNFFFNNINLNNENKGKGYKKEIENFNNTQKNNFMLNFIKRLFCTVNFISDNEVSNIDNSNINNNIGLFTNTAQLNEKGIAISIISSKESTEIIMTSYKFEKYFLSKLADCLEEIIQEMNVLFIKKQKVKEKKIKF